MFLTCYIKNMGDYLLGLISRRKSNWSHLGSSPRLPTENYALKEIFMEKYVPETAEEFNSKLARAKRMISEESLKFQ